MQLLEKAAPSAPQDAFVFMFADTESTNSGIAMKGNSPAVSATLLLVADKDKGFEAALTIATMVRDTLGDNTELGAICQCPKCTAKRAERANQNKTNPNVN